MAYKRYGGSLNRTGLDFTGKFTGIAFTLAFVGSLAAYHYGSFLLLGFSIFLPLCLLLIGGKLSGKDGNSFQDKRMAKHLADAQKHINSKQTDICSRLWLPTSLCLHAVGRQRHEQTVHESH